MEWLESKKSVAKIIKSILYSKLLGAKFLMAMTTF